MKPAPAKFGSPAAKPAAKPAAGVPHGAAPTKAPPSPVKAVPALPGQAAKPAAAKPAAAKPAAAAGPKPASPAPAKAASPAPVARSPGLVNPKASAKMAVSSPPVQRASAEQAFAMFDKQGHKAIAHNEVGSALRAMGLKLTEDQLVMLGNKAHDECGATVSQQQFGKYVEAAQLIEKRDQEIMAAFRVFETEGQPDIINVEEFRHAMMTLGDKLTDEEMQTVISDAGVEEGQNSVDCHKILKLIQAIAV